MPLRNQPYLPLYVQDYLTDEKLNSCSASSQGVYIKIMCILHKQTEYGCLILFKQKDKQNSNNILNFAYKFAKLLPFDQETIFKALEELIDEDVLQVDGDKLYQKRMVKDGAISEARSKAGKSGGGNPNLFKQIPKQTHKQITEIEYENEIDIETDIKGGAGGNNFNVLPYEEVLQELLSSDTWIESVMRTSKLDSDSVKHKIIEFIEREQAANPEQNRLFTEIRRHCVLWIGTQIEKEGKLNGKKGKEFSYNEAIDLIQAGKAVSFSKSFIKKGEKYILK